MMLRISNDNLIEWDEMKRASDGEYVNDATVTFALKDSSGSTVSGGTGSLSYVSGSNGKYQGVVESTVSLTQGATYYLELTATSGTRNGFRRIQCGADYAGTTGC